MTSIEVFINGQKYQAFEGETVLELASRSKIFIPALCHHCDIPPHESCRLCMVEIEGEKGLKASCSFKVKSGMRIYTETPDISKSLRTNLDLLYPQHAGKCENCSRKESCKLTELFRRYSIDTVKFSNRKADKKAYNFGPSVSFDPSKCINCENCSEICAKQTKGGFIRPREGKLNFEVGPSHENDHDCIYCGQCIIHCPVGALSELEDFEMVKKLLSDQKKKVIFQIAPAIRTTIGEEFGLAPGKLVTNKLINALKKIGAYRVFDTSFAADVTVMEEADELIENITGNKGVMFTSCCPAWVKYIEFYEPSFIKNLTSVRSPQIIMGGLIKNYWAKKEGVNKKEIVVVSIMPCTSKKFEAKRKEMYLQGHKPVDIVLTTREAAKLIKAFGIDLKQMADTLTDSEFLANPTGAGEIFGASGGVLEAALRTGYNKIMGGQDLTDLEFEEIHQYKGIKTIELNLNGVKIKAAAVSGMDNAKIIIEELKKDPNKYNYVEVMACPGGCIAGGGGPIPTNDGIRHLRTAGLFASDRSRKMRLAHDNPGVKKVYDELLNNKTNKHHICHTNYRKRKKGNIKLV